MNLLALQSNEFSARHNGSAQQEKEMLQTVGESTRSSLIDKTVPAAIRMDRALNVPEPLSEYQYLQHIAEVGKQNQVWKNFIGQGYYPDRL